MHVATTKLFYTLFTKQISKVQFSEKATKRIFRLSEYSFGIYLIHALLLDIFAVIELKPTMVHPVFAMPLITVMAFTVTCLLVILIRKVPNVGRKIT